MSYKSEIELEFGDGSHVFALKLAQIQELQEKCGSGVGAIVARLTSPDYRIEDVRETIRLGLIGGGMPPIPAKQLTDRYLFPLAAPEDSNSPWATALVVLTMVVFGLKELSVADEGKAPAVTEGSTSPPATVKGPSSGGRRSKSAK